MRIEKIQFPSQGTSRWRAIIAPSLALPAIVLVTLIVELALVERKHGIFGGGFLQSQQLGQLPEIAAFGLVLGLAQVLLLGLLFRLLKRLHGKAGDTQLFYANALILLPAVWIGLLAAKFRVLAYFSDAIGLDVIRNLGGGSLVLPFLYALDEAWLPLLVVALALGAYVLSVRLFGLHRRRVQPQSHRRPTGRQIAAAFLLLPLMMLAAGRVGDAGYALGKFNSYAAFHSFFSLATDFDRDGYSFFSQPPDPQPFDGTRYPLALDIPNNGIDEDGFGGDFRFAGERQTVPPPRFAEPRRHVVLVVLESVRADALTKVVAGRRVTPNLAALAASGTAAPEAYSHVGFTSASLKSLFTGKLEPLDDRQSLFRDFQSNGYRVGVVSGMAESFGNIDRITAMKGYSDVFIDGEHLKDERASPFAVPDSLFIDGRILLREFDRNFSSGWDKPTFLYMNFQSAHFPYHAPGMKRFLPGEPVSRGEISLKNKERVQRTYWNAVADADWLVGEVVRRLKTLGVYDETLIVVTGDHGESLFDDGFLGHGHMLNRQQTQIPLILSPKGINLPQPLGLNDIRGVLLDTLTGKGIERASKPVFQFIGSIDRPVAIGIVEKGGRWTTLKPATREVWSSETGRKTSYDTLPATSPLKRRVEQLIRTWETERWLQHQERQD